MGFESSSPAPVVAAVIPKMPNFGEEVNAQNQRCSPAYFYKDKIL